MVLVRGGGDQIAIERARLSLEAAALLGLRLHVQLSLGARAIDEAQPAAQTVHALAHVVQRQGKPERAAGRDAAGRRAEQRAPVSLFGEL